MIRLISDPEDTGLLLRQWRMSMVLDNNHSLEIPINFPKIFLEDWIAVLVDFTVGRGAVLSEHAIGDIPGAAAIRQFQVTKDFLISVSLTQAKKADSHARDF